MADKLDFKKEYKDLYLPGKKPMRVDVPAMTFFMVDGHGAPEGDSYQQAVQLLYTLTFTVKMSKMGPIQPPGYVDYVLPPLEGLWESGCVGYNPDRDAWTWTSMIRQPDFVTDEVFAWAVDSAKKKNPALDYSRIRRAVWAEGLCAQAMHTGPFSTEPATVDALYAFMQQTGLAPDYSAERRHHEIYMSDPRRTAPEKQRTVLRLPATISTP